MDDARSGISTVAEHAAHEFKRYVMKTTNKTVMAAVEVAAFQARRHRRAPASG